MGAEEDLAGVFAVRQSPCFVFAGRIIIALVSRQSDTSLGLPWRDVPTDCPLVWRDESPAKRSSLTSLSDICNGRSLMNIQNRSGHSPLVEESLF